VPARKDVTEERFELSGISAIVLVRMTAEYERIRDWGIVESRKIGREWSLDRSFGLSLVVCFEDTEYRLK
jgi:hypothetical protein